MPAYPSFSTNYDDPGMVDWEEDDDDLLPLAPSPMSSKTPTGGALSEAVKALAEHRASRPRMSDHKPGLLGKIGAIAAGAGAGFVNAGGRVRVDASPVVRALSLPGYDRKMQDWEEQDDALGANVDAAAKGASIEQANRKAEIDEQRAGAYMKSQEATAERQRRLMEKEGQPGPKYSVTPTGDLVDRVTGEFKANPNRVTKPAAETPQEATARRRAEVKDDPNLSAEQKSAYILTGRIPNKPKPEKGPKPEKEPRGTPGQFSGVEAAKRTQLRRAEEKAKKLIEDLLVRNEETTAPIYADLEREKQDIQDEYEAKIVSLGGDVAPTRGTSKPAAGGSKPSRPAPKVGEIKRYQGKDYRFDGNQWVMQ